MAGGDHEVEAAEVEPLHQLREEREVNTKVVSCSRPAMERALDDVHALDDRAHRALVMDEGEDGGVWIDLTEGFQNPLAPAHAGEPVVDDGDPHDPSSACL